MYQKWLIFKTYMPFILGVIGDLIKDHNKIILTSQFSKNNMFIINHTLFIMFVVFVVKKNNCQLYYTKK